MKELSGRLFAAVALSSSLFIAPSFAAPLPINKASTVSSDIVNVESRSERYRGQRGDRTRPEDSFEWRGDGAYYNSHRGYRERRDGFRLHYGWWFPPAAFAGGTMNDGQHGNPGYGTSHERWCYEHYRSYRSADNSFQPYGGGARKSCDSPYG